MGKLSWIEKIKVEVVEDILKLAPETGLAEKKVEDVEGLVELWDAAFFRPRGLRVSVQVGPDAQENIPEGNEDEDQDHHSQQVRHIH